MALILETANITSYYISTQSGLTIILIMLMIVIYNNLYWKKTQNSCPWLLFFMVSWYGSDISEIQDRERSACLLSITKYTHLFGDDYLKRFIAVTNIHAEHSFIYAVL